MTITNRLVRVATAVSVAISLLSPLSVFGQENTNIQITTNIGNIPLTEVTNPETIAVCIGDQELILDLVGTSNEIAVSTGVQTISVYTPDTVNPCDPSNSVENLLGRSEVTIIPSVDVQTIEIGGESLLVDPQLYSTFTANIQTGSAGDSPFLNIFVRYPFNIDGTSEGLFTNLVLDRIECYIDGNGIAVRDDGITTTVVGQGVEFEGERAFPRRYYLPNPDGSCTNTTYIASPVNPLPFPQSVTTIFTADLGRRFEGLTFAFQNEPLISQQLYTQVAQPFTPIPGLSQGDASNASSGQNNTTQTVVTTTQSQGSLVRTGANTEHNFTITVLIVALILTYTSAKEKNTPSKR